MPSPWPEIGGLSLMGSVMTVITIASAHAGRAFGGYFFGRPIWFDGQTRPIRFGLVLLFCGGIAAFCWAKVLWLLLGMVIPG